MADFKDILASLPALTPYQLEEVRKRVSALQNFMGQRGTREETVDDDWLLSGIIEHLKASGLGATIPPYGVIKKLHGYAVFNKKSVKIREFIEKEVPNLTKTEKRAMGIVLARCLDHNIKDWSEVSLTTLMRFVGKVPEALDESYPGYTQAGCLHMLVKNRRMK